LEDAPPPPGIVPWRHRAHGSLIAFKTGTSYGFRDAWAIGYDASFTVGVWVGRPDGTFSPGRLGREAAAPILFEVFDRLGPGTAPSERMPEGVLLATTAQLPANLQRFDKPDLMRLADSKSGPAIVFPADGTTLELSGADGVLETLPLKAAGGEMPLLWLVNGQPIAASPFRRQTQWLPDGAGLARVTVIDRAGRAATAEVWVR
jgi:penicillin-binding protein 1C